LAETSGTLAQFAATTSAQLAGLLSDETGTGLNVFNTNPTLGSASTSTPALIVQAATSQSSGDIVRVTDSAGNIYTNFYPGGFAVSASDFSSVLILDGSGMSLQNSLPLTVGNTVLDAFGRVNYSATSLLKLGDNITAGGGVQVGTAASAINLVGVTVHNSNAYGYQPTPAAVNASGLMTAANLLTGIITSTTAATVSAQLPTGTNFETGIANSLGAPATNTSWDFSVINTGVSNTLTITTNTGWTLVGGMAVTPNTSGRFRARKTATNTFTLYRI
jgi:hypothetical protein